MNWDRRKKSSDGEKGIQMDIGQSDEETDTTDRQVQLSFTRAHAKGLGQIMPYSEAALLPIYK